MIDLTAPMGKLLEKLRTEQDAEGSWTGELASGMNNFFYATSLVVAGEPKTHPAIVDICDLLEKWQWDDGGFPLHADEPPDVLFTHQAILLLGWARPESQAIAPALRFVEASKFKVNSFPLLNVSRLALDPSCRSAVLADKGPSQLRRRFSMYAWPRIYERFRIRDYFRQPFEPPSAFIRTLFGPMTEWMFWPVVDRVHELPAVAPPHIILSILPPYAAIRRLAGDKSPALEKMNEITLRYMADYRYADGSVLYLNFLPSFMMCAEAFGRHDELKLLRSGLTKLKYRKGGFLKGSAVAINVLDTAMTMNGLMRCGLQGDPMVAKAAAFLRDAQAVNGMWSWGYENAMKGHRLGDTDDTSAACMALGKLGADGDRRVVELGAASVRRLQARSGAIDTFDISPASNTPSISTTSRGVQAMLLSGFGRAHPNVQAACAWIASQQESDGKWIDHWVARWIYGTVLALEGLLAARYFDAETPQIQRAVNWLLRQQNTDGGWGEDWRGKRSASTPEHTAMAVYGLSIGARPDSRPTASMEAGLEWLIRHQRADGSWDPSYIGAYSLGEGYASTALPAYWALHAFGEYQRVAGVRDNRVARLRRSADDHAPGDAA